MSKYIVCLNLNKDNKINKILMINFNIMIDEMLLVEVDRLHRVY